MSAYPVAAETCPNCATRLPATARFCPACGVQVDAGETVQEQVPPNETGQVPVSMQRSEPHWFGVAPPQLLLSVAVIAFVFAIVLFVIGHWPFGLILLGAAALLLAAFLEAARRRPQSAVTRASTDARERARSSWETLRVRQAAAAEVRRTQNALLLLESDRRSALHELGAAAHAGDATAEAAARTRLTELDERESGLRAQLDEALGEAHEKIRKARLPVQETQLVPPQQEATPQESGGD
jgi:ABC-type multidrug transport system fused ATPase/permease subunit